MFTTQLFTIVVLWITPTADGLDADTNHVRLMRHLLDNPHFDKRVRPVIEEKDTINVTLRMTLYQLLEVLWTDEFLAWNPADFDNVSYVVVPHNAIWRPDSYLYNGLEMSVDNSERHINIELRMLPSDPKRAHIRFAYPARYTFSCSIDIQYFPFDQQNCSMIFGSWVLDSKGIDYYPHNENVSLEPFRGNAEWELKSFKSYRHSIKYTCCPNPYTNVFYHLVIVRKPLFYISNLVIPIVTTAFISFIGFFCPSSTTADRSERISLGITTLLAMAILLLMVAERMPTTSDCIPLLGWFLLLIIVMTAAAIISTTFVIQIQRRGRFGRQVSPTVRKIFFNILAKVAFVDVPDALLVKKVPKERANFPQDANHQNRFERSFSCAGGHTHDPIDNYCFAMTVQKNGTTSSNCDVRVRPRGDKLSPISTSSHEKRSSPQWLRRQLSFEETTPTEVTLINEWEILADIVERLFLIFYLTPLVLMSVGFMVAGYGHVYLQPSG